MHTNLNIYIYIYEERYIPPLPKAMPPQTPRTAPGCTATSVSLTVRAALSPRAPRTASGGTAAVALTLRATPLPQAPRTAPKHATRIEQHITTCWLTRMAK